MVNLPVTDNDNLKRLNSIFESGKVTLSYKFYWLLAIIDELEQRQKANKSLTDEILLTDLAINMLSLAFYPTVYFKLNFGFNDKLSQGVQDLVTLLKLPITISPNDFKQQVKASLNQKKVSKIVNDLLVYVPERFLSPWYIKSPTLKFNSRATAATYQEFFSNALNNQGPYLLYKCGQNSYLKLNQDFLSYFCTYSSIIKSYAYYHLTLFLEKRNQGVPNIAQKLIKDTERSSLKAQKELFNSYFKLHGDKIESIYSRVVLTPNDYAIDHFIPWSFMLNDLIYNLAPIDTTTNSQKSNLLPSHDLIEKLALLHFDILQNVKIGKLSLNKDFISEYSNLGQGQFKKVLAYSNHDFVKALDSTLSPLLQIATNNGFAPWKL